MRLVFKEKIKILLTEMCLKISHAKLEQLECMRSEDTLSGLMITHTIESYWILSEKKKKSKLQI